MPIPFTKSRSLAVRRRIPNAGWASLVVAVGMATLAACSHKNGLPERLSCSFSNHAPAVWEDGRAFIDFGQPSMLLKVTRKFLVGEKTWTDGADRVIVLTTSVDRDTGRLAPKSDTLRIHLVEQLDDSVFRIRVGSMVYPSTPAAAMTCIGRN